MSSKTLIGEKILSLRKDLALTQEALGEKIGVSRGAIAQFESGDTLPAPATLVKLSQALEFNLSRIWRASSKPSLTKEEFRVLPYFPIAAHVHLHNLIDPADEGIFHVGVSQTSVLHLPEIDYWGAVVLEIKGHSMMPRFPHGSRYVVHRVDPELKFAMGVHLFILNQDKVLVRRIIANKAGILTYRADAIEEETTCEISELLKMREEHQCLIMRVGQAVHMPPEE